MSLCQITFVFGEQSAQIAAVVFDKTTKDPFAELQRVAATNLDLGADLDLARVFFQYEDDDGDYVTLADNADALEAFTVHEDAAQDDILLIVRLRPAPEISPAGAKVKAGDDLLSDGEDKEDEEVSSSTGLSSILDENFVLEFCAFLSDPVVRQVLPEVSANISAAVLKRASGRDLYDIAASNAVLKQKPFLNKEWPFMNQWISAYDAWILGLTEDQLGKVAFQIPIVLARLVAKREKLYKAIFVKHKSHKKVLKITQFDFGSVDFASLLEQVLNNPVEQVGHAGRMCSVCKNAIDGVRYQCMVCVGFDMCETCESSGSHPSDHAIMKFRNSVAGLVGLSHASAVYGKKALKYQLKAMKQEAKIAKKEARIARKVSKEHYKHEKHHKHGKHVMPPAYVPASYASVFAGERKPVKGFYGPVVTENADGKTRQ